MKHIAILQPYLLPYRVPLFNAIAGHPEIDLTLVYYSKKEESRKATLFPEKRFREIQCCTWGCKTGYDTNFQFPISLSGDLRNLKPDIVICFSDFGGLISLAYSKFHGARYIIWSEATEVTEANISYIKILFRKWIYSNAWRFIVPGAMAEHYLNNLVPQSNFFFANNSVEEDVFTISERELMEKFKKDKLMITFSGSIIKDKGIVFLLGAFKRLLLLKPELKERFALRILGTGPLDLRPYHDENIYFDGFCEGEKYFDFIKSSHIFILPSLHDCNPLVVIEALFAGNVIIVTEAVGSHPEAVNGNGMIIPPGSADEVFKALDYITAIPRARLTEMALTSLTLAQNFTTERSADGFLSAILA